jgi:hypothetical protein
MPQGRLQATLQQLTRATWMLVASKAKLNTTLCFDSPMFDRCLHTQSTCDENVEAAVYILQHTEVVLLNLLQHLGCEGLLGTHLHTHKHTNTDTNRHKRSP